MEEVSAGHTVVGLCILHWKYLFDVQEKHKAIAKQIGGTTPADVNTSIRKLSVRLSKIVVAPQSAKPSSVPEAGAFKIEYNKKSIEKPKAFVKVGEDQITIVHGFGEIQPDKHVPKLPLKIQQDDNTVSNTTSTTTSEDDVTETNLTSRSFNDAEGTPPVSPKSVSIRLKDKKKKDPELESIAKMDAELSEIRQYVRQSQKLQEQAEQKKKPLVYSPRQLQHDTVTTTKVSTSPKSSIIIKPATSQQQTKPTQPALVPVLKPSNRTLSVIYREFSADGVLPSPQEEMNMYNSQD